MYIFSQCIHYSFQLIWEKKTLLWRRIIAAAMYNMYIILCNCTYVLYLSNLSYVLIKSAGERERDLSTGV